MILRLFGEIVADRWAWLYDWFEIPHACPQMIRDALAELPDGETLVLEINSPGGDVFAGFEMYGVLRGCKRPTEAHIISMAASAATTLMVACDTVLASPVAQIMIHQPSAGVDGYLNNTAAEELSQYLDSIRASILNGYQLRCGEKATRKQLQQLVDASTWMPVQDAIALGLVDGLLDASEDDTAALSTSAGKVTGVRNAIGCPDGPADLLARYEQAVRNGAKPAQGHPVQTEESAAAASSTQQLSLNGILIDADGIHFTADRAGSVSAADTDGWKQQAAIDLERERWPE